ncbi:MAG: PAS domain S-box protein [Burkholderiales bacterium]
MISREFIKRWRVGLLSAAGALALAATLLAAAWHDVSADERRALNAAAADTANLALAFERQTVSEVSAVERLVLGMKDAVEQQEPAHLRRILATVDRIHGKRIAAAAVVDREGNIVENSLPLKPVNIADLEHFRVHVERDTGKAFISKPLLGRVSGKWSVHVSHRVNRSGGGFGGIVTASLDLDALGDFYRQLNLGEKGFILLVGADGVMRARQTAKGFQANMDLRSDWPELWREAGEKPDGSATVVRPDGGYNVVSYRKVENYPLTVVVGEDKGEILQPLANNRRNTMWGAGLISLFAWVLIGMLWLLIERARRRSEERSVADARLRESEQRFRDLTELSSDWWWEQDADLRFVALSDAPGYAGLAREVRIGKTRWELTDSMPVDATWDAHRTQLLKRQPFKNLLIERKTKTHIHHVLVSGKPVFDERGTFQGYRGVTRDITAERRRVEETLQTSEERYQRLFEANPLPMWVRDAGTMKCLAVNEAALCRYGYRRDAFLALGPEDLQAPGAWESRRDMVTNGRGDRVAQHVRHRIRDGSLIDVELTSRDITFDGKAARFVIVNEVTARKQAEVALMESEQRLRALLDGIPDRAWLKDTHGRYIALNRNETEALTLSAEQVLGRTVREFRPGDQAEQVMADDAKVISEGRPMRFERQSNLDGAWRELIKVPIMDKNGAAVGMVGISRDISERRAQEAERHERDRAQRHAFVREVHHRIKNHIQGVAGLLMGYARREPAMADSIKRAISQLQSVAVVHGLHAAAGVVEGPLSLADMVAAICYHQQNLGLGKVPVDYRTVLTTPVQVIEDEAVPVALIVNELVLNAVKHTALDDTAVTVQLDSVDTAVRIVVTNGGRFQQPVNRQARELAGSGLRIVRSLLPSQGATFDIRSVNNVVRASLVLRSPIITGAGSAVEAAAVRADVAYS